MSPSTPLHFQGVLQLSQMLEEKKISSVELTQTFIKRIKTHDQNLGTFLAFDENTALTQARQADQQRAQGKNSPLLGIPIAHKDVFVTKDYPTTGASKMLENYMSPFDASVVDKLTQAGTINLGKLNCDEFAMGGSNERSAFKEAANPWDLTRIPGGSSGGSAAAIAAGLTPVATGSDTGGSIRQPSSFNGITGIKPTYGRCSRHGMLAFASSFDQAGAMAHSAQDCALLLQTMSGFDERDATSIDRPVENYHAALTQIREGATATQPLKGLRIGLPKEFFNAGVPDEIIQPVRTALAEYEKLGAQLLDISLPLTKLAIPVYYVITPAEASSNLSCFDGIRYGHRAKNHDHARMNLEEMYERSRSEAFGPEVKRRIMIGTYVLSHGYYDAYYVKAQKIRRLIAQDLQQAFQVCDIIAGPTTPGIAWKRGEMLDDPVASYLTDVFTLPANLAGLPAMSIPVGFGSHNMPVGMQLIGNYWQEASLLHTAHAYQQTCDWHLRHPQGY